MITAGVDIGSNSFRLLIAEVETGKIKNILYEERIITRLAEGLIDTGLLKEENMKFSAEVLGGFKEKIEQYGADKSIFVATSAVREASNSNIFLGMLRERDISVKVIDGNYEGFLTLNGVNAAMDIEGHNALIFDIGGGSTEFIYSKKGVIDFSDSLKLGVVKFANSYDLSKSVSDSTIEEIGNIVSTELAKIKLNKLECDLLVATAGTATTVAAIDQEMTDYDYRKVNGYEMSIERLYQILNNLAELSIEERKNIKGLEKGREDLIIPGLIILVLVMEETCSDKIRISDFGVREGIVIAAANT